MAPSDCGKHLDKIPYCTKWMINLIFHVLGESSHWRHLEAREAWLLRSLSSYPRSDVVTKMAIRGKMHIDIRVIEVTELNSVVRSELRGHLGAAVASEAMTINVSGYQGI